LTDAAVTRQARRSTLLVGGVAAAIAAWNLWQGRETPAWLLGSAAAALLLTGAVWPAGSRVFFSGWMRLAALLGYVNSRILLGLVYFLVITPYGLVMRLFGRDVLQRRGAAPDSYWVPRKHTRQPRERYERLF